MANETVNFSIDSLFPQIYFTPPTKENGSASNEGIISNVTIENASDLNDFRFFVNGENYSFYKENLLVMFNFDNVSSIGDSTTRVVDISMYSNNATITNAVYNSGKYDSAIDFTPSSSRVRIPSFSGLNSQSQATISGWVYQNTLSTGQYLSLIHI